jgi:hypothetical protein
MNYRIVLFSALILLGVTVALTAVFHAVTNGSTPISYGTAIYTAGFQQAFQDVAVDTSSSTITSSREAAELHLTPSDLLSLGQLVILGITLPLILLQVHSYMKVEKARFEYDIFKDTMERREWAHKLSPSLHDASPGISEGVGLAGSRENFLIIRSTQDFFDFAFKLRQERLRSKQAWRMCESQIKLLMADKFLAVWDDIVAKKYALFDQKFINRVQELRHEVEREKVEGNPTTSKDASSMRL